MCIYACLYVCMRLCMYLGVLHPVTRLQSLPLLLPCTPVGDLAVHPFLASMAFGDLGAAPFCLPSPKSLHAPILSPAPLHVVSSLAGPGSSGVLPPATGGVGNTDTGNWDPTGTWQLVLPSLSLQNMCP